MYAGSNENGTRIAVFALLGIALCGCSPETVQSARRDAERNAGIVGREAKRAERKARPQLSALQMGAKVTAALLANDNLPKTIRVDADERGVKLRGTVKTGAQRALAGRIARDTLKADKTVANELKVKQETP